MNQTSIAVVGRAGLAARREIDARADEPDGRAMADHVAQHVGHEPGVRRAITGTRPHGGLPHDLAVAVLHPQDRVRQRARPRLAKVV